MKNDIICYLTIACGSLFIMSCTPARFNVQFRVENNTSETIFLAPMPDKHWSGQLETIEPGSMAIIKAIYHIDENEVGNFNLLFTTDPQIRIIQYYTADGDNHWWYLSDVDDDGRQFFNVKLWSYEEFPLHNSGYTGAWTFTIEPEDLE